MSSGCSVFEPGEDGQEQNLGQRPPAAERGTRELFAGMVNREEGRTPAAFTQEGGCWAPRRSRIGWRALWKAGVAPNEVFTCAPVFEILRWNLIAGWGNIQGTAHTPSSSAPNPGSEEGWCSPPQRSPGHSKTLTQRLIWSLANLKSQLNDEECVC